MIGIAGAGRMAQALGRLLRERGEPVVWVAARHSARARAAAAFIGPDVEGVVFPALPPGASRILIAVSDDAVASVASSLAETGMRPAAALHTCGAFGAEALRALAKTGVSCGALHPLQTVPTPEQGVRSLPGVAFAIEGTGEALEWAERVVALLGGKALLVPPDKRALYHAAAVTASNHAVALVHAAVMLMGAAGIGEKNALEALAPLVRASFANALEFGPATALTGPVSRGDADTVAAHLDALADAPVSVRRFYRAAALHALAIARARGLSEESARKVEVILLESDGSND